MKKRLRKFKRLLDRSLFLEATSCGHAENVAKADQAREKVIAYFRECCNEQPPRKVGRWFLPN